MRSFLSLCHRHQFLSCLALLLLLLTVLFFPVVSGQKSLLLSARDVESILPGGAYSQPPEIAVPVKLPRCNDPGAPAWFAEPYYQVVHDQILRRKILPLWNPHNGFGVPLLANMQSQPLFPLTALAWLSPSPFTVSIYLLLRLLTAGCLMFLFVRLFLPFLPACAAAISFMLSGYFVLQMNMPELSVAAVLPGLFWAVERLLQKPVPLNMVLVAVFTALCILGGMPETTMLVLVLAGLYLLVRTAAQYASANNLKVLRQYILASALGCALAAPQVLPFIEYMGQSFSAHQVDQVGGPPGDAFQSNVWQRLLTYLVPLCYGPLGRSLLQGAQPNFDNYGYWGMLTALLAGVGAVVWLHKLLRNRTQLLESNLGAISLFFSTTALVFILKRFGAPLVSLLGHLPLFQLVYYPKYGELLIAFAVSVQAAIGLESLISRRLSKRLTAFVSFAFLFGIVILVCVDQSYLADNDATERAFLKAVTLSLLFAVLGIVGFIFLRARAAVATAAGVTLVIALAVELAICFLVPTYYRFAKLPSARLNPYSGAPYIEFLQSQIHAHERIMGMDNVLYPDWAGAFNLYDVRNLDAIYPGRYFRFVRNFAYGNADAHPPLGDSNITTRFTGSEPVADFLASDDLRRLWLRFFQLSSVRYILSSPGHLSARPNVLIEELLKQTAKPDADYVRRVLTTTNEGHEYALFQHPYAGTTSLNTLRLATRIEPDRPFFAASVGIDATKRTGKGDGARFTLAVQLHDETPVTLATRFVNPCGNEKDRAFFELNADLSKYAGKDVQLLFTVDPGPAGDNSDDWAEWVNMRWLSASSPPAVSRPAMQFTTVYSKEVDVSELPRCLPRAAFYTRAAIVEDGEAALKSLRDPDFDLWQLCTIERGNLSQAQVDFLERCSALERHQTAAQQIDAYEAQRVAISVNAEQPGILVLNDTGYPGWSVYVDGKQETVHAANYLFRAVFLEKGKHLVEFKYECKTFVWGLALACLALAVLLICCIKPRARDD